MPPEGGGEMRRRDEAAARGNLLNARIGFLDQFGGALQAQFDEVLVRSRAASLFEQIYEVKTADAGFSGESVEREIFRRMMPHKLQHAREPPISDHARIAPIRCRIEPAAVRQQQVIRQKLRG